MRYLEGDVIESSNDPRIAQLESEIVELRADLRETRHAAIVASKAAANATAALRRQLAPLYHALQAVFGELDAIGPDVSSEAGIAHDPRWQSWKTKLGVGPGKVIDALLEHGEMNTQQIAVITGYHRNTVPQYVSAVNKAGLLVKNGGKFSLRKL